MSFSSALSAISTLVANFREGEAHYRSPQYQESEVRSDFIDKFFIALGWDVLHVTQTNPYQQEVKVEKKPDSSTQRKADYAFSILPKVQDVKFFVEAKKPSAILTHPDYYFQAIRYGWNAGTPLVVLTDFEEFHILDCRAKPVIGTILDRCIRKFHYTEYENPEAFAEIYWLFSREAVAGGSIAQFASTLLSPKKQGKGAVTNVEPQSIDESFLRELDEIRKTLAKAFKKTHPEWDGTLLTEATQRVIDRLVFLRFLEDKLIEPDPLLASVLKASVPWTKFRTLSASLAAKYNGAVFAPHFVDAPKDAGPDPAGFLAVCRALDRSHSPYDFNSIPIHILGSVYERFLGKVIRATAKQVVVEDRPEVRKAGGVTYTPLFIVRQIVERTLGALLEKATLKQVANLRIVDLACGSGSFLLTVFEVLLDWYQRLYQDAPEAAKRDGCLYHDGHWVLTLRQKRDILLRSIHGVDLDPQAVEITQLSLYLKLLEDETTATANDIMVLFKEKLLPDLSHNIVVGNSLIGTDILTGSLFSTDEEKALLPLDFSTVFPTVMKEGGFDVVVGNPPYVRQETLGRKVKSWLAGQYAVAHGMADLYTYFIERGMSVLKPGGRFGYIVANKWMRANYGKPLRSWLKNQGLELIVDFGDLPVFPTVTTYPCLLFLRKESPAPTFSAVRIPSLEPEALDAQIKKGAYPVTTALLDDEGWSLADTRTQALLAKIRAAGIPLGEYVQGRIYYGIKTGLNEAFVIDAETQDRLIAEDPRSAEVIKPFLAGRDIKRYETPKATRWLIFLPNGWTRKQSVSAKSKEQWLAAAYPAIHAHLKQFEVKAKKRYDQGEYWWELRACDYCEAFEEPKILLPDISLRGNYMLDDAGGVYSVNTTYIIGSSQKHLLAILNSRLLSFYYRNISPTYRGGYLRYIYQYLEKLPIPVQLDTTQATRLAKLVEKLMALTPPSSDFHTKQELLHYAAKRHVLEEEIDRVVCSLYGLSSEESDFVTSIELPGY